MKVLASRWYGDNPQMSDTAGSDSLKPGAPGLHLLANSRLRRGDGPVPSTGAAVFLDRDGIIIEDVHFLQHPHQINVLPGVAQALRDLQDRFYLIVATNQSGIARGLLTEQQLEDIHQELARQLDRHHVGVDAFYFCPHLPRGTLPRYDVQCQCRKPKPGMLLQAASDWRIKLDRSFLVGDSQRDVEAGCAVGVKCILVGGARDDVATGYEHATNLVHAARLILGQVGSDKSRVFDEA